MANDALLRVLSRYAPRDEWTDTGRGYMHALWGVTVETRFATVRRDLPKHTHILVTGSVNDLDALMARAERMAWWDAREESDGNE